VSRARTSANASKEKVDPKRVALAGESAGGNLALATAIAARDSGIQKPAHVLAVYPVTQTSRETESYLENAVAVPLNRAMMGWFFDKVATTPADLKDPRLQLIDSNLQGLPSVTLINARIDVLRSDGAKMEDALKKAGVPVERRDFCGRYSRVFWHGRRSAKSRGCAGVCRSTPTGGVRHQIAVPHSSRCQVAARCELTIRLPQDRSHLWKGVSLWLVEEITAEELGDPRLPVRN
jgi:acetyl esterase/lipase